VTDWARWPKRVSTSVRLLSGLSGKIRSQQQYLVGMSEFTQILQLGAGRTAGRPRFARWTRAGCRSATTATTFQIASCNSVSTTLASASVNEPFPRCAVDPGCRNPELCPLNEVKAGTYVRIKHLAASPDLIHRLRELGFCEEQQIKLVSRHANLICQVCNARLGISPEIAGTILVEPLPAAGRPVGVE